MSDDLVAFLHARLDEDEQTALGTKQNGLSWQNFDMEGELRDDRNAGTVALAIPETRQHIARHDPARVLREIEAKRRILDLHAQAPKHREHRVFGGQGPRCDECFDEPYPCRTLRLLALPYASHDDYRPKWRP